MDVKFALALLHFNLQYVAGGMVGFGVVADDRTAEQVEDQIIKESFEPVLDLLLAHPAWGLDLEMQGYMLEVLGERHPAVLSKLKDLTARGQAEIVSFHYSDQLFLAFPRAAWDWSVAKNQETFARLGIPRSAVVFCQEGQAGPAMAGAMKDNGYGLLLWPKNLFSYEHDPAIPEPLYAFGDVQMMTTSEIQKKLAGGSVSAVWTFVDDGELLATGGQNPYFPSVFLKSDKALKEYATKLAGLEGQGYTIGTVSAYLKALAQVVTPAPAPPLLDGTWQPNSTDGIHKWLGGRGLLFRDERDNDVRSLQALAQRELVLAQTIAKKAGRASPELDGAWRLLALGEVSDSSGINPFRGEVEYGLAHAAEALRIARDVITDAKARLGIAEGAFIDADTGAVTPAAPPPVDDPGTIADSPLAVTTDAADRTAAVTARAIDVDHFVVQVRVPRDPEGQDGLVSVTFAGTPGDIVYTPGFASAPVHLARDAFAFDHFYLALSDGLIGLGGGWYVVKDQAMVHAGARVARSSADVAFSDETAHADETQTWRFHLVRGDDAKAASVARAVNVAPRSWR
jgi:hypothetical protein